MGAVVLGAWGGEQTAIAPPGDAASVVAGSIAGVALATIFLIVVSAVAITKLVVQNEIKGQCLWLAVAVVSLILFLLSAFYYYSLYQRHVLYYKDSVGNVVSRVVIGDHLSKFGSERLEKEPTQTPSDLIAGVGGVENVKIVWDRNSISQAKRSLMSAYILLLVSVGMMIFTAVELSVMTWSIQSIDREHRGESSTA